MDVEVDAGHNLVYVYKLITAVNSRRKGHYLSGVVICLGLKNEIALLLVSATTRIKA